MKFIQHYSSIENVFYYEIDDTMANRPSKEILYRSKVRAMIAIMNDSYGYSYAMTKNKTNEFIKKLYDFLKRGLKLF